MVTLTFATNCPDTAPPARLGIEQVATLPCEWVQVAGGFWNTQEASMNREPSGHISSPMNRATELDSHSIRSVVAGEKPVPWFFTLRCRVTPRAVGFRPARRSTTPMPVVSGNTTQDAPLTIGIRSGAPRFSVVAEAELLVVNCSPGTGSTAA